MTTIALSSAGDYLRRDNPATVQEAESIIDKWPHLERTTGGGRLTDTLRDLIERAARETQA